MIHCLQLLHHCEEENGDAYINENVRIIAESSISSPVLKAVHIRHQEPENIAAERYWGGCGYPEITFKQCVLYVPSGTEDAYRQHPAFSKFTEIVPEF